METGAQQMIFTPEQLFGNYLATVLNMIADHSPFPRAQTNDSRRAAKLHAARIHLAETVYFGQVVYRALQPSKTIEVCSGYSLPTLTMTKRFGTSGVCVDMDEDGLAVARVIAEKLDVSITQIREDLFIYLRRAGQALRGMTLMATAAFCSDQEKGRPPGSGEGDLVDLAVAYGMDLAILPYRSGETMRTGISQEKKRLDDYQGRLRKAGYEVRRHPTKDILPQAGAPDWFYLEILTAGRQVKAQA